MTTNRTLKLRDVFFWLGVALTTACLTLVLAGNIEAIWRLNHTSPPLSWVAGIFAILAFVGAELFDNETPAAVEQDLRLEVLQEL